MNKNININIVLLNKEANVPTKQHELDIGYDIYSDKKISLKPGIVTFASTGICIQLPKGCGGFILPRSGLASKHSITSINSPGLIDPGSVDSSIFGTGKFFKEQSQDKKDNIYSDVDDALKQTTKIEE